MSEAIARAPEPRTRIRIEHTKTIKEGWGYETTVEVEWFGEGSEAEDAALLRLETLLECAEHTAIAVRDRRNAEEHTRHGTE